MYKRKYQRKTLLIIILLAIIFTTLFIYENYDSINGIFNEYTFEQPTLSIVENINDNNTYLNLSNSGILEIDFIDVGQADCILLIQGEDTMLIDGGNDENGKDIIEYIKNKNINDIDYVIGTHAHADHIGGLDKIINYFNIGKIYFPKQIATTKNYEDFVKAVKNKNIKLTVPTVGEKFSLGNASCEILSPENKDYEKSNNYSIVLKVVYGNTNYLFMGDAEKEIEKKLLEDNIDIKADVLKVGHHGSNTSSTEEFLKRVNPSFAIISVGKDNDYNLPAEKIINRLNKLNINIYRTDILGTIVLKSDGNNIILEK